MEGNWVLVGDLSDIGWEIEFLTKLNYHNQHQDAYPHAVYTIIHSIEETLEIKLTPHSCRFEYFTSSTRPLHVQAVSYTHLTLPTIYSV